MPSQRPAPDDSSDAPLRHRAVVLAAAITTTFGVLSWRLIHLQSAAAPKFAAQAAARHSFTDELPAPRGTITDARGVVLARDESVQQLVFDLGFLRETRLLAYALEESEHIDSSKLLKLLSPDQLRSRYLQRVAAILSDILHRPAADIESEISSRFAIRRSGEVVLEKRLDYGIGNLVWQKLEAAKLGRYQELRRRIGGIVIKDYFERTYPSPTPVDLIVGRFAVPHSEDTKAIIPPTGVSGIEKTFHTDLTGTPGSRTVEIDGHGDELAAYRGSTTQPTEGRSVRLTIDTGLQEVVQQEIDNLSPDGPDAFSVARMNPDAVIVVLFEPATMALRALVGRDFTRKQGSPPSSMNYLVDYLYEPGSTIKIATAAAALAERKVRPDQPISIDPDGDRRYSDKEVRPITDAASYPELTPAGILAKSSNIGAYMLARRVGLQRFREYHSAFGLGEKTGLSLPFERKGAIAGKWNQQTMSRVSYGYSCQVSPAQMCSMLGCILNDGLWRPLALADAWTDSSGTVTSPINPPEGRKVIPPDVARSVSNMLLGVVEKGTAKSARSDLFEIGGKTGTAKKVNEKNPAAGYDNNRRVVSFLGYISSASGPRLAGICIIDEPKLAEAENYGGHLAAPLFRRVAEKAMNYYKVPPQFIATTAPPSPKGPSAPRTKNMSGKRKSR